MTQQTDISPARAAEDTLRHAYQEQYNDRGYHTADEVNDAFGQNLNAIRAAVVEDIAAFLDTVYQGKAADLIRAKARAGKFVNGTP